MKPVVVVGAGFSGLTLARALRRQGLAVQVVERESRVGGLISTNVLPEGMVETAANALVADVEAEDLLHDVGVEFARQLPSRTRRYIHWKKPRRWPIDFNTSFRLAKILLGRVMGWRSIQPRAQESVRQWGERVVNREFVERMLAPALQGVYAGDVQRLSARLVVSRLLRGHQTERGSLRGSIAPEKGMGDLMIHLREHLQQQGVEFVLGRDFQMAKMPDSPTVLCTSAWQAETIVRPCLPEIADRLKLCESVPLISVTAFFKSNRRDLQGFGCLFPQIEKFHALGVLFNSSIFSGRSGVRSETWIFGGALRHDLLDLGQERLLGLLMLDRFRMSGIEEEPLATQIQRWPKALPHYTLEWEAVLPTLIPPRPVYLHGNYLGDLGLTQILHRSHRLAERIRSEYGS